MRIALIGGVASTKLTLEQLVRHGLPPHRVYGYEPDDASLVSSYVDLKPVCSEHGIPYSPFRKINDHAEDIASAGYDIVFIVGLSQIVSGKIIEGAKIGCIGFHPTMLPKGRGRAPLAWLVLEGTEGAANLFLIDQGMDSGPILKRVAFAVTPEDDALDVERKVLHTLSLALDEWLPELKRGEWNPVPQDSLSASEYGMRTPDDGWIDWQRDAAYIDRLIKASSRPHPGAYTFAGDSKLIIWKSRVERELAIKGVTGRILKKDEQGRILVQTGSGLLWITSYTLQDDTEEPGRVLRTGARLGYYYDLEIYKLRHELKSIKEKFGL